MLTLLSLLTIYQEIIGQTLTVLYNKQLSTFRGAQY